MLQGLQARHLALQAGCASNVTLQPGEYVFHEGQEAAKFFPDDVVSVHWGWVCDILDARRAAFLEAVTRHHVALINPF